MTKLGRLTYVKLTKHVTGRQGHLRQILRVPSRQDDASIFRIVLDLVNAIGKLVHTFSRVIRVHVDIVRAKMTPLKTVHRSQIANLPVLQVQSVEKLTRAIAIPNVYILGRQIVGIRVPLYKKNDRF